MAMVYMELESLAKSTKGDKDVTDISVKRFSDNTGIGRDAINKRVEKLIALDAIEFLSKGWSNKAIFKVNSIESLVVEKIDNRKNNSFTKKSASQVAEKIGKPVVEKIDNQVAEKIGKPFYNLSRTYKESESRIALNRYGIPMRNKENEVANATNQELDF